MSRPPLILCPLAHEAALLRRLSRALPIAHVTGPGAAAGACVGTLAVPGQLVVLVGTAGGLREPWRAGRAALVCSVRDEPSDQRDGAPRLTDAHPHAHPHAHHHVHLAQRLTHERGLPGATVATTASPLAQPAEKARLAAALDADLVDCESTHFARAAEARGCPWLIVRGVSDGPGDTLPPHIGGWVDSRGRTRIARICVDLLRCPSLIGALPRLSVASRRAMEAAARLLESALEHPDLDEAPLRGGADRTADVPSAAPSQPLEVRP